MARGLNLVGLCGLQPCSPFGFNMLVHIYRALYKVLSKAPISFSPSAYRTKSKLGEGFRLQASGFSIIPTVVVNGNLRGNFDRPETAETHSP